MAILLLLMTNWITVNKMVYNSLIESITPQIMSVWFYKYTCQIKLPLKTQCLAWMWWLFMNIVHNWGVSFVNVQEVITI